MTKIGLIVYKKHTGKPFLTHKEAMEEAICFGWIDTTIKRIDQDRYLRYFAKRNKNGKWSKATQRYARELVKRKLMMPAGLFAYKEGLKKPTHDHGIPLNPEVPIELLKEFKQNKKLEENFYNFAPSYRRTYLRWIERAKRKETREKRIAEVVKRAVGNNKGWN